MFLYVTFLLAGLLLYPNASIAASHLTVLVAPEIAHPVAHDFYQETQQVHFSLQPEWEQVVLRLENYRVQRIQQAYAHFQEQHRKVQAVLALEVWKNADLLWQHSLNIHHQFQLQGQTTLEANPIALYFQLPKGLLSRREPPEQLVRKIIFTKGIQQMQASLEGLIAFLKKG